MIRLAGIYKCAHAMMLLRLLMALERGISFSWQGEDEERIPID